MLNPSKKLRSVRMPMAIRVLTVAAFALVALTVALLLCARQSVQRSTRAQITSHVLTAEKVLAQLAEARGTAHLTPRGDLAFGSWVVKGDHSVVDNVKQLTGADATLFEVRDGVPRRITTTVLKLNSHERNDGTELTGAARVAFGPVLQRDLVDASGVSRASVSELVELLSRDELVETRPDAQHGRRV